MGEPRTPQNPRTQQTDSQDQQDLAGRRTGQDVEWMRTHGFSQGNAGDRERSQYCGTRPGTGHPGLDLSREPRSLLQIPDDCVQHIRQRQPVLVSKPPGMDGLGQQWFTDGLFDVSTHPSGRSDRSHCFSTARRSIYGH
jgi:hypothetical protein